MPMGAIIAMVGAVAGFLGIGVWFAISARKIRWPQGDHSESVVVGDGTEYRCRAIVVGRPVDLPRLARVGAIVARSVSDAWSEVRPGTSEVVRKRLKHVGVYLLSDTKYNELDGADPLMDNSNGTVTHASRIIGSSIPLATARLDLLPSILADGGVVLHEMVHIANRAAGAGGNIWTDVRHEDEEVWGQIQSRAREIASSRVQEVS